MNKSEEEKLNKSKKKKSKPEMSLPENSKPVTKVYQTHEEFYKSIPVEGSLGILAYGAKGLLAWRKKRDENKKQDENKE
jgi:hypothetical protein